jgi:hypothetical protein
MPSGLVVKVNNFGFALTFTILNADGTPRDLTGETATLWVFTQEEEPTISFSGTCTTSVDPVTGIRCICTYIVAQGDFSITGTFDAEVEMTTGFAPIYTYLEDTETFSINVIARHPVP